MREESIFLVGINFFLELLKEFKKGGIVSNQDDEKRIAYYLKCGIEEVKLKFLQSESVISELTERVEKIEKIISINPIITDHPRGR